MPDVTIEIRPRRAFRTFIETTKRWMCLIVHRRGGKTFHALAKLVERSHTTKRPGPPLRYAYIAPTQAQAKDIAWGYLKRFTHGIPGAVPNEAELKITFPDGMTYRLYSGENYERMRGLYFDGVILDEPEDIPPHAWYSVIRPCLSDYQGWAIWIGTVKGKKGQWKRHLEAKDNPEWFTLLLKASDSGIIPEDELADIRMGTPKDVYEQEFECNPNIGIAGAIYAKDVAQAELDGRICNFEPDAGALVHTTWDIGSPMNTAVTYFQRIGPRLQIIDFDYGLDFKTGERVAHMMAKGYNYGYHCLPHDSESKAPTGLSFRDELIAAGLKNTKVIPRTDDPEIRINRARSEFKNLWFRKNHTVKLIESLENYQRKEDPKTLTITTPIFKNWACHGCFPAGTLIETKRGHIEIENVIFGDEVMTPAGWDRVTRAEISGYSDTLRDVSVAYRSVSATLNHPFFTDRGLVMAEDLRETDTLWTRDTSPSKWSSMGPFTNFRDDITSLLQAGEKTTATFTAPSGPTIMDQFQRAVTFITGMETATITGQKISNAFPSMTTSVIMPERANGTFPGPIRKFFWKRLFQLQKHGTPPQRVSSGTGKMATIHGRFGSLMNKLARLASYLFRPQPATGGLSIAVSGAERGKPEDTERLTSHVLAAEPFITGPSIQNIAATRVGLGTTRLSRKIPVYNLTVENHHCFYANGFLVSNSDSFGYIFESEMHNMIGLVTPEDSYAVSVVINPMSDW